MNAHTEIFDDPKHIVTALQRLIPSLLSSTQDNAQDPIIKITAPKDVAWLQDFAIPGDANDLDKVIGEAFSIFHERLRVNHPRFIGLIPSPTSPVAWLGDVIASAFNALGASKLQASGPVAVEKKLVDWLGERAGLPRSRGGLFVSGGSMANLMAMVMARDRYLSPEQHGKGVVYMTSETHFSVVKALRLLGFGHDCIRRVSVNNKFQMDVEALEQTIVADRQAGLVPFAIVATCGTTNTGAVDPMKSIWEMCKKQDIWMHIDGAYGASVSLSARHRYLVADLTYADSVSWDAHKWLFQTYSMELMRPAHRAMKLWFTLRVLGVQRIGEMIDHGFALAEVAEESLRDLPDWEIISSPSTSLAILTFKFAPHRRAEEQLDVINAAMSSELVSSNTAGILTIKFRGRVVLRICALSPALRPEEMEGIVDAADGIAKRLTAQ